MIFINGIVLLFTWLNQCVMGATILSLPWSQLAYAYIIAIVWYIYIIGVPAFDDSTEQALFDSLKPAGPLAVIQFLIAFSASAINIILVRRVIRGESV